MNVVITYPSPCSILKKASSSMALCYTPTSLGFQRSCKERSFLVVRSGLCFGSSSGLVHLARRSVRNRSILSFAASHEESKPFIFNFITAIISGGVAAFYAYRISRDGEQTKGSNSAAQTDN